MWIGCMVMNEAHRAGPLRLAWVCMQGHHMSWLACCSIRFELKEPLCLPGRVSFSWWHGRLQDAVQDHGQAPWGPHASVLGLQRLFQAWHWGQRKGSVLFPRKWAAGSSWPSGRKPGRWCWPSLWGVHWSLWTWPLQPMEKWTTSSCTRSVAVCFPAAIDLLLCYRLHVSIGPPGIVQSRG